jgi:hypothetical protein
VCSIRRFVQTDDIVSFGPLISTCPSRFLEDGEVFRVIGETILGTNDPMIVKEIPFLVRPPIPGEIAAPAPTDENGEDTLGDAEEIAVGREDVGRIDMVLIDRNSSPLQWCALEMQAVYFSGGSMNRDMAAITEYDGDGTPMPQAYRRPDFRSSGPKRLMPQLQIKVPTLRRWGKKMAIVVDRPFFDALGEMDHVPHLSNADIVWFVVRFDEEQIPGQGTLVVDAIRYTTLERAVEGLTAGIPVSLPDFEGKIRAKIGDGGSS